MRDHTEIGFGIVMIAYCPVIPICMIMIIIIEYFFFRNNKFLIEGGTCSLDGDAIGNYPNGVSNVWICIIDTSGNLLHQTVFGNGFQNYSSFNRVRGLPNGDIYYCGNSYLDSLDFAGNAPFSFNDNAYIARTALL